jgi:SAM-dependent methyltransferase
VNHIDDSAAATLKSYYGSIIKPNHGVLDICSSWVSHMPESLKPQSMIGYGMNKQELSRNGHLTRFFVKDLNKDPSLSEVPDNTADVVICSVSVDYLTQPVSVFRELHRVLKTGGHAHMAFSNRCFPTKVIGKWMQMSDEERRKWVGGYFWASGEWEDVEEVILKEGKGGFFAHEDPLYVVRARKAGK